MHGVTYRKTTHIILDTVGISNVTNLALFCHWETCGVALCSLAPTVIPIRRQSGFNCFISMYGSQWNVFDCHNSQRRYAKLSKAQRPYGTSVSVINLHGVTYLRTSTKLLSLSNISRLFSYFCCTITLSILGNTNKKCNKPNWKC
jgi:hypothetical protein